MEITKKKNRQVIEDNRIIEISMKIKIIIVIVFCKYTSFSVYLFYRKNKLSKQN